MDKVPCIKNPENNYTRYPCDIDDSRIGDHKGLPIITDLQNPVRGEIANRLRESIIAIEKELGPKPSSNFITVGSRFDAIEDALFVNSSSRFISIENNSQISDKITTIKFIGANVKIDDNKATICIPSYICASHFDTYDGNTCGRLIFWNIDGPARIAKPTEEGNPFLTSGFAGCVRLVTPSSILHVSSDDKITGFGGDSSVTVILYDGNKKELARSELNNICCDTSKAEDKDGHVYSDGISIEIIDFSPDGFKYQAVLSVVINLIKYLPNGGMFYFDIIHKTNSDSDGTGPYTYTSDAIFFDANDKPKLLDNLTISEVNGKFKYISGIKYYTLGSVFNIGIDNIKNINRNSINISDGLIINANNYGILEFEQGPLSSGSENFISWNDKYDNDNVAYVNKCEINKENHVFIGDGKISAIFNGQWIDGTETISNQVKILVDTNTITSSNLTEHFDDENWRCKNARFDKWDSTIPLEPGEAMVMNSCLMVPNSDWSEYSPKGNPNYSSFEAPVTYYRLFNTNSKEEIIHMIMTFEGTFIKDAVTDLKNEDLQIYLWKIDSSIPGHSGTPEHPNKHSLMLHGKEYDHSTFNDYSEPNPDGHIRESSSGNVVNATFGGYSIKTGFYCKIVINNPLIIIDGIHVVFFGE
jgi:hypothetical protein